MISKLIRHWIFAVFLAGFVVFGVGYVAGNLWAPFRPVPEEAPLEAPWIRPEGREEYSAYFRHKFHLNHTPKRAWLRVAAHESFVLSVNGDIVGRWLLWRPTRPFSTGLSEQGQALSTSPALLRLNYPREYQWSSYRKHRLPVYFDITPYLKQGGNLLTFKVESRRAPAKICFEGAVSTWVDTEIPIQSGIETRAEAVPIGGGHLDWEHPNYNDQAWNTAVVTPPPSGSILTLMPAEVFQQNFDADWLRPSSNADELSFAFSHAFELAESPQRAWIRILANRAYQVYVNDQRVNARVRGRENLSAGDWVLNSSRVFDYKKVPELLDPDEVGELTVGDNFLTARSQENKETADGLFTGSLKQMAQTNVFRNRDLVGGGEKIQREGAANLMMPDRYAPDSRVPPTLARNRQFGSFDAFDITRLMQPGTNTIRIRLLDANNYFSLSWQPQLALDGLMRMQDGTEVLIKTDELWIEEQILPEGVVQSNPAIRFGQALQRGAALPRLNYQGDSYNQREKLKAWGWICFLSGTPLSLALLYRHRRLFLGIRYARFGAVEKVRWAIEERERLAETSVWLLPPATLLFCALVTKYSWTEREEILLFFDGTLWAMTLLGALVVFLFSTWWIFIHKAHLDNDGATTQYAHWLDGVPSHPGWKWAIAIIIILGTYLRAMDIDFQTIDDDEYASLQSIQGIIATGTPQLNEDIWYTRSPFYHYLAALVGWVFGFNLWSMRGLSVLWGAATAYLLYRCGRDILKSPWVGLGGLLLYTIHPFLIYTAHIARFYQQQQFFALLTVYFFCLGFSGDRQKFNYRVLCILAFFAAVLSQEISVVLGVALLFGYLLFSKRASFNNEASLVLLSVAVVALIAINILIFQTKTLTHLDGVSPNVEATIKPNFSSPMNYLSLFLGYSRLHLPLSLMLLLGVPFMIYLKDKQVVAFYMMLFAGVVAVNVLVTGNSLRYQYWLIPIWLLLGLMGPKLLADRLTHVIQSGANHFNPSFLKPFMCTILLICVGVAWSPWRILPSYQEKILGDASGAFQYINANKREGDKVAATEPHPHGMLMETGQSDYDIAFPLLYDFVYKDDDGNLVDRNAQAKVIHSVEELINVCAQHDRIWFAINREKFRSRGKNLRWEYPGARAELFLRKNCTLAYQSYLWSVFLWDVNEGEHDNFRHNWNR